MAGGIGSRFWPLSTPEFPKQFIDILGCGRSLIQLTVDRFEGICPESNFWVVTNQAYVDIVKEQIPSIPDAHILAEPAARNTAPCIAWACWSIRREDPDANVVVTPSDAVVMNPDEFRRVISGALEFTAGHDFIVTIGIKPNRPETGYGYVKALGGDSESRNMGGNKSEIKAVEAFKEKPDLETAKKYLADGNYLWNAGIFVWNVKTITDSIRAYKPVLAEQMDAMVPDSKMLPNGTVPNGMISDGSEKKIIPNGARPEGTLSQSVATERTVPFGSILKIMPNGTVPFGSILEIFPRGEKISIDYAVMEPAAEEGKVFTYPADFGWSDLGNWQSLHEKLEKDSDNNAAVGNVRFYESSDCVVHTEGLKKVVLQGLEGYIVSEKGGQLLVCKRSEEQRIKIFSAE